MNEETILRTIRLVFAIALVLRLFYVVVFWSLFNKAGEKGWKILIPFYGGYIQFKTFWETTFYWPYVILSSLLPFLKLMNNALSIVFLIIISVMIVAIALGVNYHTAERFKTTRKFAIFTALIPIIGLPVLAFSERKVDKSEM